MESMTVLGLTTERAYLIIGRGSNFGALFQWRIEHIGRLRDSFKSVPFDHKILDDISGRCQ